MLTTIGISLIVLALVIFFGLQSYVGTKAGTVTIVRDFGGKAVRVLTPGVGWILWPYQQILTILKIETITRNIKVRSNCLLNPIGENESADFGTHGLVEVECEEVSFHFRLNANAKETLDRLFQVISFDEAGKPSYDVIVEMIKDKIQTTIKSRLEKIGLMEASLSQDHMEKDATEAVKAMIDSEKLPIAFGTVIINSAFRPTDKELAKALDEKPKAALERSAAREAMDLEVFKSEKNIEIAKNTAEAKASEIRGLMAAFGSSMSDAERRDMYIVIQQLEALKSMPGSTIILPGNLLDAVNSLIGRMGGRQR